MTASFSGLRLLNTFSKDLEVIQDKKAVDWNYQPDPFVYLVLNKTTNHYWPSPIDHIVKL